MKSQCAANSAEIRKIAYTTAVIAISATEDSRDLKNHPVNKIKVEIKQLEKINKSKQCSAVSVSG